MKREDFMRELSEHLVGVSAKDKEEILKDYEDHFVVGKKKKRKESDIAKSLGEPRLIAREIRRELSYDSSRGELKDEAIETYVAGKKLLMSFFGEVKERVNQVSSDFQKSDEKTKNLILIFGGMLLIVLIFSFPWDLILVLSAFVFAIFLFSEDRNHKHTGKKRTSHKLGRISGWKLFFVLVFNVFVFLGIWIFCVALIFGFFVGGIGLLVAGLIAISFSIFALISHGNPVISDILYSVLFASIGAGILGSVFISLSERAGALWFKFTKNYFELNSRIIRK